MDNNICPNMEVFGTTSALLPITLATIVVYSSLCFKNPGWYYELEMVKSRMFKGGYKRT